MVIEQLGVLGDLVGVARGVGSLQGGKDRVVRVQLQHLRALDALCVGHAAQYLLHLHRDTALGRQGDGVFLQGRIDLDLLDLAVQVLLDFLKQILVLGLGSLGSLLLVLGLQTQVTGVDVLKLLLLVVAHHLQAELIHILGAEQQVVALAQHQLGVGQLAQTVCVVTGGKVDALLILGHLLDVLVQRDELFLLGGVEHQQVAQQILVHAVVAVDAKLDLAAKVLPEGLILLAVIDEHRVQLVLDLLFQRIAHQLELVVLLQRLTADVQTQILAVHNTLHKAEIIRQQVGTLLHDHNAGGIQRQTLLVLLGVVVVRGRAGDEQQRGVGRRTLGAAGDDAQRVGVVHELVLVELVVVLILDLVLRALPDGHHAVQRFQLGVGLVLGLVVVARVLRLRLLAGFLAVHRDGEADVVAVLLNEVCKLVILEVLAVLVGIGVVLQHQNDLGADVLLVSLGQGVALDAGGLPLPGRVSALCAGDDGDLFGHHERGIEADAELTDDVDVIALVLGLEVKGAGPGNRAEVLLQLLLRHADAVIGDGQRAAVLVGLDVDFQVVLRDADGRVGQALEVALVAGVRCVGDQLTQEDLAVCIDRIDHQVKQLFALGLKLMHSHGRKPHFIQMKLALVCFNC